MSYINFLTIAEKISYTSLLCPSPLKRSLLLSLASQSHTCTAHTCSGGRGIFIDSTSVENILIQQSIPHDLWKDCVHVQVLEQIQNIKIMLLYRY